MPGVLERRGEDVDLRWWRGWWMGTGGEVVWGASPIPAAQPVALFARPDQEFSC